MDSCIMAPATTMAINSCGTHLRARVLGTPRAAASVAGWRIAPQAPKTISRGHRYSQINFPPRWGPPSCSSPV